MSENTRENQGILFCKILDNLSFDIGANILKKSKFIENCYIYIKNYEIVQFFKELKK